MVEAGEKAGRRRPPARRPDLDTVFSINPDGSRNAIQPADVRGRFQRRKQLLWGVLIGVYLLLPWATVDGRPAVLIDIARRHFYLFGQTFNAQDFWLAFFLISGLGFTLFVVAALWGRLWCGYACPQTVFLEGVFRRIERLVDGSAQQRVRLAAAPLTPRKVLRRLLKHALYLLVVLVITHSFLGYFMPVREMLQAVTRPPTEHPTAFLVVLVASVLIYVNFAWFREQLCIVVCPYGRLQGALYDQDTVVVGYDRQRGEPRGEVGSAGAGDCVDCYRCVAVCPTGIDIRNGTQMECVGCANCIDACDEVMARVGRPRGLVRYDSERGLGGGGRRFWRGRVLLYGILLAIGATVFAVASLRRTPFEANLVRMAGPAFVLDGGVVQNAFQLHLVNKLPEAHEFTLSAATADGEVILGERAVRLESLADRRVAVIVRVPEAAYRGGAVRIVVHSAGIERTATAPLAGPVRSR